MPMKMAPSRLSRDIGVGMLHSAGWSRGCSSETAVYTCIVYTLPMKPMVHPRRYCHQEQGDARIAGVSTLHPSPLYQPIARPAHSAVIDIYAPTVPSEFSIQRFRYDTATAHVSVIVNVHWPGRVEQVTD